MRSTTNGSILSLAFAAFCVFGFLATSEPTNNPGVSLAFRISYAVVGLGCVAALFGPVSYQVQMSIRLRWRGLWQRLEIIVRI
jgi:hypothetical protein